MNTDARTPFRFLGRKPQGGCHLPVVHLPCQHQLDQRNASLKEKHQVVKLYALEDVVSEIRYHH
jgi:hypothetical protein